ncbi:MAG: hypothetical protein IPH62_00780 [Ignavibacteriae bacterium]|nr:hypothetical protein [Ignavibacteriota bacterium]
MKISKIIYLFGFVIILSKGCFLVSENNEPKVELKLFKNIFNVGESFEGEFIVLNNSDEVMSFTFNDSKQYGLIISNDYQLKYEIDNSYIQVVSKIKIKSNDTLVFKFKKKLQTNEQKELPIGKYKLTGYYDIETKPNSSVNFEIQ